MSDATPEGGNTSGDTPAAEEFKPITSQEALNEALKERLARERAKFKDYDDIKAKAARLDEIEQANQTEVEKAAARLAALEAELNDTRRNALRLQVAATHGITDADDIELFLTSTDEATLEKQAKRLAERTGTDDRKKGPHVPREGATPQAKADERVAFANFLVGQD